MQTVHNRLLAQLGCEPTSAEVAREMRVKEQKVQALLALRDRQVVSLHTYVDEESDTSFEDMLEDSTAAAFADDGFFSVEDVLRLLPEQERGVFQLRFGLAGGRAHTQREVAEVLGIALSTVQVLVVEVVEIFCNYALAAAVIQRADWLQAVSLVQRSTLTVLTYVVLSIIPLVSLLLAVVDMDLERSKSGGNRGMGAFGVRRGPSFTPPWSRPAAQPKQGSPNPTALPLHRLSKRKWEATDSAPSLSPASVPRRCQRPRCRSPPRSPKRGAPRQHCRSATDTTRGSHDS